MLRTDGPKSSYITVTLAEDEESDLHFDVKFWNEKTRLVDDVQVDDGVEIKNLSIHHFIKRTGEMVVQANNTSSTTVHVANNSGTDQAVVEAVNG